jgi:hypothetical protein
VGADEKPALLTNARGRKVHIHPAPPLQIPLATHPPARSSPRQPNPPPTMTRASATMILLVAHTGVPAT